MFWKIQTKTPKFNPSHYSILPPITSLTNLTSLKYCNSLGPLPQGATILTNLKSLSFSHTECTDQQFLSFTNLKDLTFRCNSNSLQLFTNLEALTVSHQSTLINEEELFKSLSKLTSFRAWCDLKAEGLLHLTNLEILQFHLKLEDAKDLSALTNLKGFALPNQNKVKCLQFLTNLQS